MSCPVHGYFAGCRCEYARKPVASGAGAFFGLVVACALIGCAALQTVTPADRAAAYAVQAKAHAASCKAYRFDRSVGLVADVPAMTEMCQ